MRNILAIVVGFLSVAVLSMLADYILESTGVFPSVSEAGLFDNKLLAIAFIYRSIFTILGGYIAAKISADKVKRNIIILGSIGTVFGILGVIAGWNLSHHWYPIALALFGFPCIWIGGILSKRLV